MRHPFSHVVQEAYEALKKKNDVTPEPNPFDYESWCVGNPFYEEESPGDGVNVSFHGRLSVLYCIWLRAGPAGRSWLLSVWPPQVTDNDGNQSLSVEEVEAFLQDVRFLCCDLAKQASTSLP